MFSEQEQSSTKYLTSLKFEYENEYWIRNLDLKVIFEMQVKSCYLNIRIKSYDKKNKKVSSKSAELKLVQIQNPIYVLEI